MTNQFLKESNEPEPITPLKIESFGARCKSILAIATLLLGGISSRANEEREAASPSGHTVTLSYGTKLNLDDRNTLPTLIKQQETIARFQNKEPRTTLGVPLMPAHYEFQLPFVVKGEQVATDLRAAYKNAVRLYEIENKLEHRPESPLAARLKENRYLKEFENSAQGSTYSLVALLQLELENFSLPLFFVHRPKAEIDEQERNPTRDLTYLRSVLAQSSELILENPIREYILYQSSKALQEGTPGSRTDLSGVLSQRQIGIVDLSDSYLRKIAWHEHGHSLATIEHSAASALSLLISYRDGTKRDRDALLPAIQKFLNQKNLAERELGAEDKEGAAILEETKAELFGFYAHAVWIQSQAKEKRETLSEEFERLGINAPAPIYDRAYLYARWLIARHHGDVATAFSDLLKIDMSRAEDSAKVRDDLRHIPNIGRRDENQFPAAVAAAAASLEEIRKREFDVVQSIPTAQLKDAWDREVESLTVAWRGVENYYKKAVQDCNNGFTTFP